MNNWITPQDITSALSLEDATKRWKLDLEALFSATPSRRCRQAEARRKIIQVWSGASDAAWQGDSLTMQPPTNGLGEEADLPISESAMLLDAIASRPLAPKELC
ncbi:MAG: hypothetical protein QNI87_01935 [Erythrobacter sp.]|nr:hypothetical protein [Erythrobacter sp.]